MEKEDRISKLRKIERKRNQEDLTLNRVLFNYLCGRENDYGTNYENMCHDLFDITNLANSDYRNLVSKIPHFRLNRFYAVDFFA